MNRVCRRIGRSSVFTTLSPLADDRAIHRGQWRIRRRWLLVFACVALVPTVAASAPTLAAPRSQPAPSRASSQLGQVRSEPAQSFGATATTASMAPAALRVGSDFNGDGYSDLAVGVPDEDVGTIVDAGAVDVVYGSGDGPEASGAQLWTQGSPGVLGRPERQDRFGYALGQGDFNGDGFSDLAIGVPREDVGLIRNAGAVNVLYGSAMGLTARGNQLWAQSSPGIKGRAERWDLFGFAVAAGDFDRNGHADLAVGVPFEDLPGGGNSGTVNVLYGSGAGLKAKRNQLWNQDSPGIKGVTRLCGPPFAELCERFGWALAAANFGKGRAADLAIGVPGEETNCCFLGAGAVNVIYGTTGVGLTARGNQAWSQGTQGVKGDPFGCDPGSSCTLEFFGSALIAANFGKSAQAELAIGVPGDFVRPDKGMAGGVNVLYGSTAGLVVTGNQLWNQDSPGVMDDAEGCFQFDENCTPDEFGAALAAANFGKSSHADLAVGAPQESLGMAIVAAGAVNILYGSTTGLTAMDNQFWTQDSPDVADAAEDKDGFGSALFSASFGRGAERDLAIGVPRQDVGPMADAGAVNLLFGSSAGLAASGNQFWHQDGIQIRDAPEQGDHFGRSLG
jgi:disulfide bond formation protein DsbB